MNRIFNMALAGLFALALVACSNTTTPTTPSTGSNAISDTILKVQEQAKTICGFLPALETITGLVGAFSGQGNTAATVSQVANTICQVVAPKPGVGKPGVGPSMRDRASGVYGTVEGVKIKGAFVAK